MSLVTISAYSVRTGVHTLTTNYVVDVEAAGNISARGPSASWCIFGLTYKDFAT